MRLWVIFVFFLLLFLLSVFTNVCYCFLHNKVPFEVML